MNLSGNKGRLVGLTRDISLRWAETKEHWRDAKSEEFERRFMAELSANVNRTVDDYGQTGGTVEKSEERL